VTTYKTPRELAESIAARRKAQPQRPADGWTRHAFKLPRDDARREAMNLLQRFPKAAYDTQVESWRELPGDIIEFTIKRLPTAD
jgi:hypothetical protein